MRHLSTYILFLLMCISLTVNAQGFDKNDGPGKHEFSPQAFKKHMEDFILKETDVTPQEGEKFFPMLHEMFDAQRKIKEQERCMYSGSLKDATESQCENIILKSTELNVENERIEQKYMKKFHSVISWKKIAQVRIALKRFQMQALRQFAPKGGPNQRLNGQGMGPGKRPSKKQ